MKIKIIDILMYVLAFTFYFMLYGGGCSKNPGEPEPIPDPCAECEAKPCDPVPCVPVPCDSVFVELGRVEGVWHITYVKDDKSVPQNYGLIQNDVKVWTEIDNELGTGEVTVLVPGNFEIGDKIEPFHSGSNSRFWYRFQRNIK